MKNYLLSILILLLAVGTTFANSIKVGEKLPLIEISDKGLLIPEYDIKEEKMVYKVDTDISHKKWTSSELFGRVGVVYHLAARAGVDDINKPFIDALIAADLPEYLPGSPYKTTTILNTDDALWGTAGIASGRFEKSQKKTTYAIFVNDCSGVAQKTWGLKQKESAVIILDNDGSVLYFKEGKLTEEEINKSVNLIQTKLGITK